MKYIDCLNLINSAIDAGILRVQNGLVLVYCSAGKNCPEGWYGYSKEDLAQKLMSDKEGQNVLITALNKCSV